MVTCTNKQNWDLLSKKLPASQGCDMAGKDAGLFPLKQGKSGNLLCSEQQTCSASFSNQPRVLAIFCPRWGIEQNTLKMMELETSSNSAF